MFNLCASGVDGCGLEGRNVSTTIPGAGAHNQGKLGSGISLGDLHFVLWLYKLGLLVGVDIAVTTAFSMSLV